MIRFGTWNDTFKRASCPKNKNVVFNSRNVKKKKTIQTKRHLVLTSALSLRGTTSVSYSIPLTTHPSFGFFKACAKHNIAVRHEITKTELHCVSSQYWEVFLTGCCCSRVFKTKRKLSAKGRQRQPKSTGRRLWPRCLQCRKTSLSQTRCCTTTCRRVCHRLESLLSLLRGDLK